MSAPEWHEIEQRAGFENARSLAERDIAPALKALPGETLGKDGTPKSVQWPFALAFGFFIVAFLLVGALTPDNFIGVALRIITFPVLFVGAFILVLFLFQDRFLRLFLRGQERYLARSKALASIAALQGLAYAPSPGGAPETLRAFSKWRYAPRKFREITELLDMHGGLDAPLAAAKRAGVLGPNVVILASAEQKRKYLEREADGLRLQDGFEGVRDGLEFAAFEWVEAVDDAPDIHHLTIVLQAPARLQGVTQLRSRGTFWPRPPDGVDLEEVDLARGAFSDRFRVRAQDQTEARAVFNPAVIERTAALAHDAKIRAVAFQEGLVIDVAGGDRFNMIDLATGVWSDETIRQSYQDVTELLDLIDAAVAAFMLRAKPSS
ncbi:MAG: DUF3137 domain-containing protein [Pseudomonadota bacterium]